MAGPIALKQLYDSITSKDSTSADYANTLFNNPAASQTPADATPSENNQIDSGLDFFKRMFVKEGGSIHRYKTGGDVSTNDVNDSNVDEKIAALSEADYRRQMQDLRDAFQGLSDPAPDARKPDPAMSRVRTPPNAYAPRPLQQMSVIPQLAALLQRRGMNLAQGGNVADQGHPNYDGIPAFRTGGLEGLGGKYVEGKGNGTSDDIAAMLANGEYVFSADVVAALGNGSNKAGASALDQMVSRIRERARSAPPSKLSPDAKSPLEYLKSSAPTKGAK